MKSQVQLWGEYKKWLDKKNKSAVRKWSRLQKEQHEAYDREWNDFLARREQGGYWVWPPINTFTLPPEADDPTLEGFMDWQLSKFKSLERVNGESL